jgi:hypothetical protein
MNWCHREPTLDGILSDSIVGAVMEADGIEPQELVKDKADALEAELKPLVGGPIVAKMFKYDTDPAHIHSRRVRDRTNPDGATAAIARTSPHVH